MRTATRIHPSSLLAATFRVVAPTIRPGTGRWTTSTSDSTRTATPGRTARRGAHPRPRRLGAALIGGAVLGDAAARRARVATPPVAASIRTSRTTGSTFSCSASSVRFAFVLGYAAGQAANRRHDARVFLLSLAFMATGGFLGLHALGPPTSCSLEDPSRLPGSDPDRADGERRLRGRLGVRRHPVRASHPPSSGVARCYGLPC